MRHIAAKFTDGLGGLALGIGANIASDMFHSAITYLQSLDAQIKNGTIPLPATSVPLQINEVGNINEVSLNDPAQASNVPVGSGNDALFTSVSQTQLPTGYTHWWGMEMVVRYSWGTMLMTRSLATETAIPLLLGRQ